MRQGLDAERNALLERERALRRREVADVRQSFDAPFAAPSFSEGLAAFVSSALAQLDAVRSGDCYRRRTCRPAFRRAHSSCPNA